MQNEHNANNSRHAQFDTEEAIHRMQFSPHPKHESQEEVRDLNNTDYKQVSPYDLVVEHHVNCWHFNDQHVLNGLPDEVNRVVQEETKRAVVGDEHKAKHEAQASESSIHHEEYLIDGQPLGAILLLLTHLKHHIISLSIYYNCPTNTIIYNTCKNNMIVKVVTSKDHQLLSLIKNALVSKWLTSKVDPRQASRLFDQKVNNNSNELLYGVMLSSTGEILIVAALYLQYKLTRGLSQIYHLQIQYKRCSKEEQLFFQSQVIQMIPGYKITGLHVAQSQHFPPHQVYMETTLHDPAKTKPTL